LVADAKAQTARLGGRNRVVGLQSQGHGASRSDVTLCGLAGVDAQPIFRHH
jgi:hypothetical protein